MIGSYTGRIYTVMIDKLLEQLEKNREEHVNVVIEAQEAFKKATIEKLEYMLQQARSGQKVDMSLGLVVPTVHTDAFDNAIGLLKMNKEALTAEGKPLTIEITSDEYERFVRNKWEWTDRFIDSNRRYSGSL